jgi:hypothetical protein
MALRKDKDTNCKEQGVEKYNNLQSIKETDISELTYFGEAKGYKMKCFQKRLLYKNIFKFLFALK